MLFILKGVGATGVGPGVEEAEASLPGKVGPCFTYRLWKQHPREQEAPLCVQVTGSLPRPAAANHRAGGASSSPVPPDSPPFWPWPLAPFGRSFCSVPQNPKIKE